MMKKTWMVGWLAVKLALLLAAAGLDFAWKFHQQLILAAAVLIVALLNTYSIRQNFSQTPQNQPPTLVATDRGQLQLQLEEQLDLLSQYPTHRDVLLNLALIYRQLGDETQAQLYLDKAKYQDPNSPPVKDLINQ